MGAAGAIDAAPAAGAAASSLRSEDSTERLIRVVPGRVGAGGAPLALTLGGAAQACAGALLLWCGGAALVRSAGAGVGPVRWAGGAALWAGGAAVAAGALAALAGLEGIRVRHTEHRQHYRGGGLERAALALSLVGAACAHAAGALAAAALQRLRSQPTASAHTFKEEMEAWSPVVASGAVLAAACAQCALSGLCAYVAARRVCPCLRPARAPPPQTKKTQLAAEDLPQKRPQALPPAPPHPLPPLVLLPAPSATLGRVRSVPLGVVVAPRYATLPLPPARPLRRPLHHPPFYNPQHDHNTRQRQRRDAGAAPAHAARSLERVHRRGRRATGRADGAAHDHLSDADLRRTYTGLDRAYAEQFIAVCDESRSQATERSLSGADTGDACNGDRSPADADAAAPTQATHSGP